MDTDDTTEDHLLSSVPLSERRGAFTMGLLWITMVTCFPNVLAGFRWFHAGMSLKQLVFSVAFSCLIVLLYGIPASYMGAKFGLSYTMLSRAVFGRWGARLITLNVIWISLGWYALNAIFLADGIRGLFDFGIPQAVFVAIMALLMAVNNFFGFNGVANFAKYLAAPVLLFWVGVAFVKSASTCPVTVWNEASNLKSIDCLTMVSSFVVGISCWGNEPDYWRFGKPKWTFAILPLSVALLIGMVIFPITGWMMAKLTGVHGIAGATRLMNDYVFGGLAIISAAVLTINYVAVNDAGLYATINAVENLKKIPRKVLVGALAIAAASASVMLLGYSKNFEVVAALSSIILPSATVIMMTEAFLIKRVWGSAENLNVLVPYEKLPAIRWAAVAALTTGSIIASLVSGLLPGLSNSWCGVPALPGWIICLSLYFVLRPIELRYCKDAICTNEETPQFSETEPALVAATEAGSADP